MVNLIQNSSIIGIVLAGGKSSRMGTDKAFIEYNGMPQYEYVAQQLSTFCDQVLINGQKKYDETQCGVFSDDPEFENNGPMSGVLTAFKKFPHNSLFIVGCDYPFLTQTSLKLLLDTFELKQKTVCFRNSDTQTIEPLIAIYHKNDFHNLLEFYKSGQTSLRVFLTSNDTVILDCHTNKELMSVDKPI